MWARMSYGWMGRSPDYKASLMNTLGANYDFYGKFADNAKAWYRRAQENVLFMNHAIVNPPVDRVKAGRSGQGRLHHHPEGHRRRDLYLRRQGGGDGVGADAL